MKKTYVKPEVCFESFQLSANIAADCQGDNKVYHADGECTWFDGFQNVFMENQVGCDYSPANANVCYHNPTDGANLFSS